VVIGLIDQNHLHFGKIQLLYDVDTTKTSPNNNNTGEVGGRDIQLSDCTHRVQKGMIL